MSADIESLLKSRILVLDGAMGTMLQKNGIQPGECPELFGINNPRILGKIHEDYAEAGADIIQTNTFGANRIKLAEYSLEDKVEEINAEAVNIARRSARGKTLVAASIGPTGKMLQPIGDTDFDTLYQAFSEQVIACERAGADLLSIETMTDIGEMRIALIAARHNTRLPVIAHMSFEEDGRTMMGTDPVTALIILEALQPLAIGANCSGGARELLPVIETMNRYASVFLSVEPNAGLPQLVGTETIFPDSPDEMAEYALILRDAGANIIGGCCGTTPEHIRAIAGVVRDLPPVTRTRKKLLAFASRTKHILIGNEHPLAFIGERINPTARKKLAQDIKDGQMHIVVDEARKQIAGGAPMLDVNMGVPGIDEPRAMEQAVTNIQAAVDIPISIDSSNAAAIESGLKNFVGRPLINSTTGEDKNLDIILPLAKKYGAAVLGLCLDEKGIPERAEDRMEVARKIYRRAKEYGLRDEDIYIDCLVKTASAEQSQVMETLKGVQTVKEELGVGTVLGVSNVSHGLPARSILNSSYLAMAWFAGLDLPIINPFDERMMDATRAAAVLLNRDINSQDFIEKYRDMKPGESTGGKVRHAICQTCNIPDLILNKGGQKAETTVAPQSKGEIKLTSDATGSIKEQISQAVLEGNRDVIESLIAGALNDGMIPVEIVNQALIPGIEKAGQLYDEKKYFLPQLMMAAETMKVAFNQVKQHMSEETGDSRGVIIMATVEGDIHDIGKNIVSVMLENYGFKIIDLGKDVKSELILDTAEQEGADLIGLSALMTTTMPRMKEVITGVKARGLNCKVMVGGAVLTQEYADSIGADTYAEDARQAVLAAQKLLNQGGD
ncbi:MAG: homocysteine S-methyltransferase family protein [Syntrophomonadaceae bacterium]|nr:homocysteine S-methyltransferase family protein [Syntrophomonadaceae bacterium]